MTPTLYVILGATTLLVLYDIWALIKFGKTATISSVIYKFSKLYPALPFAFGFLMGHFFA